MIRRQSFLTNVARVAGGTAVGAIVAGVSSPLLTRIYDPTHFGLLAAAMAATSLASVGSAWKLDVAIPLEASDRDASDVACAGLLCSLLTAVAVGAVLSGIWMGRHDDGSAGSIDAVMLVMLPAIVFFAGVVQVGLGIAIRYDAFQRVAIGRALVPSVAAVLQIVFGLLAASGDHLVLGQVLALAAAALFLMVSFRGRVTISRVHNMRAAISRHWRMPVFIASSNLITMGGLHAPLIVLGAFFSLPAAGLYAVTYRVLTAPSLLFGQAVGQVFYSRVVALDSDIDRRDLVAKTSGVLADIGLVVFPWLFLLAPSAFALVFGSEWQEGGEYARLLIPWLTVAFVASPVSQFALVAGRQKGVLKISLLEATLRAIILVMGVLSGSPRVLVGLFGMTGALIAAAYLTWILILARVESRQWLRSRAASMTAGAALVTLAIIDSSDGASTETLLLGTTVAVLALGRLWPLRRVVGGPA